jgi:integrase
MGLMFRVAVLRGCRRGELCGFRWADAELDKPYRDPSTGEERKGALLAVERPIVELGGKVRESKAKTRAGKRRVFLDHDTAALLREHRKAQLKVRLKAGEAWAENDLLFCQDDGQPWHPDHVSKRFKKLAALAGVPVVTLHEGGRHTGNSLMPDAGWTRSCGCARSATRTGRSTTATPIPLSRRTSQRPSRRRRWCGRQARRHDRDRCSHSVPIRGRSSEVTNCR